MATWLAALLASAPLAPAWASLPGPAVSAPRAPVQQAPVSAPRVPVQQAPVGRPAGHARAPAPAAAAAVPARARPAWIELLDPPAGPTLDPWALFDGRATAQFGGAAGTIRLRAHFREEVQLAGLGVWGGFDGRLSVLGGAAAAGGRASPLPGLADLASDPRSERWQLFPARPPAAARTFDIEWRTGGGHLRELALWTLRPAAGAAAGPLPDQLQAGTPPGARTLPGTPTHLEVPAISLEAHRERSVQVSLDDDPRGFERVFLVYELEGVPHWTHVPRKINGSTAPPLSRAGKPGPGGLQVEEIPPRSLRRGRNEITFLPAQIQTDSPAYAVKALRLVAVPVDDPAPVAGEATRPLLDGDPQTGVAPGEDERGRAPRSGSWSGELIYPTAIEPQYAALELQAPSDAVLVIAARGSGQGKRQKLELALAGLPAGRHQIPIAGSLPASDRYSVVLAGPANADAPRGRLTELSLVGPRPPASGGAAEEIAVSYPLHGECEAGAGYLRGFVAAGPGGLPAELRIAAQGKPPFAAPVGADGAFAATVPLAATAAARAATVTLSFHQPAGRAAIRAVTLGPCLAPPRAPAGTDAPRLVEDVGAPFGQVVRAGEGTTLAFAGARLEIPRGALGHDVRITIRPLLASAVRPLDERMTNAVPDGRGFRFGPSGLRFARPVKLSLPVARERLPAGTSAGDVHTFYYDEAHGRWTRLPRAPEGSSRLRAAAGFTTHFTDFITATLAIPDHPVAEHLDPTSIKDIKLGDPAAGIGLIPAPDASSTGAAGTAFPLDLPPGRNGLTPQLAIAYNSEAGNSWLGVGWDLGTSSIQVDTRFGVPRYDGGERYLLDGEPLRALPDQFGPSGGQLFRRAAERLFERIERIGSTPDTFRWEVTDKNGTRRFYGTTPQARLASYVAPGPIFRWNLETVTDTFSNSIGYLYATDEGSNGEPFRQVYLSRIEYAAHPGAAAPYSVDFQRQVGEDACQRPDTIVDGRAGFQVLTRCLLGQIAVRFGAQTVRRYDLVYRTGNFGKTLLDRIETRGLDGSNLFFSHSFEYFSTPEDPTFLDLFNAPVPYAVTRLASGAERPADGHTHAQDTGSVVSGGVGIGIPQLNLGIGGTDSHSKEVTDWRLFDLTSDVLTDGLAGDGLVNRGSLVGADRLTPAALTGLFTPAINPTPVGPLSQVQRDFFGAEAGIFGVLNLTGNRSLQNRTRETLLLTDMNGDGHPDLFGFGLGRFGQGAAGALLGGALQVRLNDRQGGFGPPQLWPNYSLEHLGCEGLGLFDQPKDAFGNLVRYVAPQTGTLAVQGSVGKALPTPGRIALGIFKNNTALWTRFLEPDDTSRCEPAPGNGCGGGLLVDVQAGDRLYFLMTPFEGSEGDLLNWDPQITYQSVGGRPLTAAEQNLREPDGGFIFRASQSEDFRLVGRLQQPWVADSSGTIRLDSVIRKLPVSDNVTLHVVRRDRNAGNAKVVFAKELDDNAQGTITLDIKPIEVAAGDTLTFEVLTDLPIDPDRADWRTIIRYDRYCRVVTNPIPGSADAQRSGGNPQICGKVECPKAADLPLAPRFAPGEEVPEPPACTVARGTKDAFPVPREIAVQQAPAFYPLFKFKPGPPTQSLVVDGGKTKIEGTFVKRSATPAKVVVAVQKVNRMLSKRVINPRDTGSFPISFETDELAAGEQIFFTVYSDTDVSGAVTWQPKVDQKPAPVNLRQRAPGFTPDPSGSGVLDVMFGGFRGWAYGDWNAYRPFDEGAIEIDASDPDPDYAPMIAAPAPVEGDETAEALLSRDPAILISFPNPIKIAKGVAKAVGRGAAAVVDAGGRAFNNLVSGGAAVLRGFAAAGRFLVGGFVRRILDTLFCRHVAGLRVTDASNTGLTVGVPGASGAFTSGNAQTRADLIDMNGDRFPDLVTRGGIRLGTGAAFEGQMGAGLPLGDPRLVRQRSIQGGIGFQSGPTLRNKTDGDADSEGYFGATIGLGLNYGVSATEIDLIDINGDQLPDHLSSDFEGNFLVRLNFGYRFGAPVFWSGSPWAIGTFSASQDLLNRFGSDLLTDRVRVEDSSAVRFSGGFAGGEAVGFGASAGPTTSLIRSVVELTDVNGDGLPDQLMKVPGELLMRVKLNLGGGFLPEKVIPLVDWDRSRVQVEPSGLGSFALGTADVLGATAITGFSGAASASGFGFIGPVPVTVRGSVAFEQNDNVMTLRLEDIDGDGGPDHVIKVNGNAQVFARLNKGSKANLLRRVKRPLGGSFELDYRREGNRVELSRRPMVDMPRNQWALASMRLFDGQDTLPQVFTFSYSEGGDGSFFDRDERLGFGYSHVRTTRPDGSTLDEMYRNQTLFERGLLAEAIERERAGGPVMRRVVNTYESRRVAEGVGFEALVRRVTQFPEGTTADPAAPVPARVERFDYDESGNVTFHADEGESGDPNDDLEYAIRYQQTELTARNIHKPTLIEARSRGGQVLRRRTAHYRADGAPDEIRELLSGGKQPDSGDPYTGADATNPRWTFDYDAFGNLTTAVDPKGFTLSYAYDPQTFTHRVSTSEVSPGFGYESRADYDLRFGLQSEVTDVAGQLQRVELDEFGRVSRIWGPNDINGGVNAAAPTIAFSYAPAQFLRTVAGKDLYTPALAITRHKDVARDPNAEDPLAWDPIDTVTFVDGLRRVVQTKRDMEKDTGVGMTTAPGMSVSGKVLFDSRGRVFKQGQPIFDTQPAATFVNVALARETTFQYDTLFRPRVVTAPDGAVTQTSYQLGDLDGRSRLLLVFRDALGKVRNTFRSVREEIVAVRETNRIGGAATTLTTRYGYDPVSQLTRVEDTRANVTTAEYDTLGHIVAATNPDAGRTEWRFDVGGNLAAREPANLRARGQLIRYRYEFNRLLGIDYPDTPDVSYGYGEPGAQGDAAGNRAGRLTIETSEAGTREWSYDRQGNIASEKTSLVNVRRPDLPPIATEMRYRFDSLGRVLQVTFATAPEETVSYSYDRGGQVVAAASPATSYLRFMGYDEFAQRRRAIYGNGIETRYEYDPATRRLSRVLNDYLDTLQRQRGLGALPLQRLRYQYDLAGNVTELANEVPATAIRPGVLANVGPSKFTYAYDDLHQLTSASALYQFDLTRRHRHSLGYGYDEISNIGRKDQKSFTDVLAGGVWRTDTTVAATTYTFDYRYEGQGPHAPSRIEETLVGGTRATRDLDYDADGNQRASQYQAGFHPRREVVWTEEDRVRSVREADSEISRALYDGSGTRTHQLTPDGDTLYPNQYLTLRNGERPTKHIFAGGGRIASKVEPPAPGPGSATFWYHPDHLQSTHFVSDPDQDLVQHDEYFASGEVWVEEAGSPAVQPHYLFNGKELDQATGLYYYGARSYDPRLNQWISADPILANYLGGAPNEGVFQPRHLGLYTYTLNNPVTLRDPSGLVERDLFSDTREIRAAQRARGIEFEMSSGEKVIAGVTVGLGALLTLGLLEVPVVLLGAKATAVALTAETAADAVQLGAAMVEAAANPNAQNLAGVGLAAGDLVSGPAFGAELNTARILASGSAARITADAAQAMRPRPGTATALVTDQGTFTGVSGSGQPLHPRVQEALDAIPVPLRARDIHGKCGEPQCISRSLEAGVDPAGGTSAAVRIRAPGNPKHGTTIPPCDSCAQLLKEFGIKWVE